MSQHSSRGTKWEATRKAVLERDGYACVVCNQAANTVDHVIPKARGGTDEMDNLQAMCAKHNLAKGASMQQRGTYWDESMFPNGLPMVG